MRLITICWFILLFSLSFIKTHAAIQINEDQLQQVLQQTIANTKIPNHAEVVRTLQCALNQLKDAKRSEEKSEKYQIFINDFTKLVNDLNKKISEENVKLPIIPSRISKNELEQKISQTSGMLSNLERKIHQELELSREISDSIIQIPLQQSEARKLLTKTMQRLQSYQNQTTPLEEAKFFLLQAEVIARQAKINELEFAQLSANNRQEISRMQVVLCKKRHERLDQLLQSLRNHSNDERQKEAEKVLESTELLAEKDRHLPDSISTLLQTNRTLFYSLKQQTQRMNTISFAQRKVAAQILQVRQALASIREQAQWVGISVDLGETLRMQVARLPEMPKSQKLDRDMIQLRVDRLNFEDMLAKQQRIKLTQNDGSPLSLEQQKIVNMQLQTQYKLLNVLLSGYDNEILELTKLKVADSQLVDALKEVHEVAHRYLFWVADISPLSLSYPIEVTHDLNRLLSLDTLSQLRGALIKMLTDKKAFIQILGALLVVGLSINYRRHYYTFLERINSHIGKVNQDQFSLTLRTVFWSIFIALPLPILWSALGYSLQNAWSYPIAVDIGISVTETVPVLWIFMIGAAFTHPNGLFIAHFRWHPTQVARAMRFYRLSVWLIIPLMIALIFFENYSDREFAPTLGRLCFFLLCIALSLVTNSFKRAGIPLYLDEEGHGDNKINRALWAVLLSAPLFAALASALGYFTTAQDLLTRLEISVAIWFFLLIIYHIVRRWMLIQRRRIAFERAKQRRADILAQRAREDDVAISSNQEVVISSETEEPMINLDVISAQSLRLIRSILTMLALVAVIALWSEIHSAFGFLENIHLWDVTTTFNGVDTIQPISMGSILIVILVIIVTTQLVRNLPSLLELTLLQHLDLAPGTGYAISTITKYLLMLLGGMVGFSLLGIEWVKFQWLVAALSVGLGFGLQDIVNNFISGLIILFEKPIRIGDTVTVRDLTGSVTKINTRATTISDWDRKEVIVPNKAFITEQFINWSLSDPITRVVLTVPATITANSKEVTEILLIASRCCSLVLDIPAPEVYLTDIQQGIQIFELRIYAAEMSHRMPLRHEIHQLILEGYRKHGIELPFPPLQIRTDIISKINNTVNKKSKIRPDSLY